MQPRAISSISLSARLVIAATLFVGFAAPSLGTTYTVTKTADTNDGTCDADCSLREAIAAANAAGSPPHTIDFDISGDGPHTITVGSTLPTLLQETHFDGSGEAIAGKPGVFISGAGLASGDGLTFGGAADGSSVDYLAVGEFPGFGIFITSGSDGDSVTHSYVGLDPDGSTDRGNGNGGILISGGNAQIGASILDGNRISGNGGPGIYLQVSASGTTIRGNYIGTDAAGTAAVPNDTYGIYGIAPSITVGGSLSLFSQGNVISGNGSDGVVLSSTAASWTIRGNNVGVDATGAGALGNGGNGISVSSSGNTIGSTSIYGHNTISANAFNGILLDSTADSNEIYGNRIGTNAAGTAAVGSQSIGIRVFGTNCTIGGAGATYANVISGNTSSGITLESAASGCLISANLIGLNAAGDTAIANGFGVTLNGSNNLLGGDTVDDRNVIAGNISGGVSLRGLTNKIQGNYIGTDSTGAAAVLNGLYGIRASTATIGTIGGSNPGEGNLISGNDGPGITLDADCVGITIAGNTIGVSSTGSTLANAVGVELNGDAHQLGGSTAAERNLISGNSGNGVSVSGTNHLIRGNFIGTNGAGDTSQGNGGYGIRVLTAQGIQIGGPGVGDGNLISGNSASGVHLASDSSGCILRGNMIGTDLTGTAAVPNSDGISVSGSNQTVGGPTSAERNVISGNTSGGVAVHGTGQIVINNYIGTNSAGAAAIGNGGYGIRVLDASGCSIGNNVVSGNLTRAVVLDSTSSDCDIQGNKIGTNAAGTAAIANDTGIYLDGTGHTVGGATLDDRNLISGNSGGGLYVTGSGHVIAGNYVGVDAAGTAAIANGGYGLRADSISNVTIGGATPAEGNVFGANERAVNLGYGSHDNTVLNNIIGLDASAATNLADSGSGIEISDSFDNQIGAPNAGNVIAGMAHQGIIIAGAASTGNVIQGNWIGTNKTLATGLGNGFAGVFVTDSSGNTIGGTGAGEGNVIANNIQFGVRIERGDNDEISGNSIYGNFFGIDIDELGFYPNDESDADEGGNRIQNYPLIASAVLGGGVTDVSGLLINEPDTEYRVEFFSSPDCNASGFGDGKTFRGSTLLVTGSDGHAALSHSIPIPVPDAFLTATVTDPSGNTSEFSPCVEVDLGESPGQFQFDRFAYVGYENVVPTTKVFVTRSLGLSGTATVDFTTSDDSAVAGSDYTDSDQVLSFAPWEVVKIVEVPILYDPAPELVPAPEKLLLALASPSAGASLGATPNGEIQIWDYSDDDPGVTVSDAEVTEGDSGQKMMTFDVHLTATDHQVKVTYLTEPGSATEGDDYLDVTDVITFPVSASTQTVQVQVPILGDTDVEPDEVVWLRITSAENGGNWIAYDVYGRGKIVDDDSGAPSSDLIFDDDFEVGSTILWSTTNP